MADRLLIGFDIREMENKKKPRKKICNIEFCQILHFPDETKH
jgi:hypothetical protein